MFEKIRKAVASATAAAFPAPQPRPMTAVDHYAVVPVHRPQPTYGWIDRRSPDSSGPVLGMAPPLRTADSEVRRAWGAVAGHVRHMLTQSGFLQYGVDITEAFVVGGDGLRLDLSVDREELGWSEDQAEEFVKKVERRFADWSRNPLACDSAGRMTFGAIQGQALRGYFATGDVLCVLDYSVKRHDAGWRTGLNLIDPARLWVPPMQTQGVHVRDGVEVDGQSGRVLAYHLRPAAGYGQTVRIPAFSGGKRLVLHAYEGDPGTVRGISPLGAAIQSVLQAQGVADAAILATHIAAQMVGVIYSDLPSADVLARIAPPGSNPLEEISPLDAFNGWRVTQHEAFREAGAGIALGHNARLINLPTGEKFDLLSGKDGFSDPEKIIRLALAEVARAFGLSPEHLHGIKDEATYSSLRWASVELKAIVDKRRKHLIEPLCNFAFDAVLEELIATGQVDFPLVGQFRRLSRLDAFRLQRHHIRQSWIGPAIPDADPLKEARAAKERLQMGLSSHTAEIAAMGGDAQTVFEQRGRDREAMRKAGTYAPWPDQPGRSQRPASNGGQSK